MLCLIIIVGPTVEYRREPLYITSTRTIGLLAKSFKFTAPLWVRLVFHKQGDNLITEKWEFIPKGRPGKIDFKVDKYGIIHATVGKASFDADKIRENAREVLQTLVKLKPAAAKGAYIKSISMSGTMSPSVRIEAKSFTD